MKRTTKSVALDVHQATTIASVRQETGRVIARTILPTEEPALVEFFRGMRGAIHVAFEEGTQAQPWPASRSRSSSTAMHGTRSTVAGFRRAAINRLTGPASSYITTIPSSTRSTSTSSIFVFR